MLRRLAYEIFLISHLPLAILLGAALWDHIREKGHTLNIMIITVSACFAVTSIHRYTRQLLHNIVYPRGFLKIVSSQIFGSTMIMKLDIPEKCLVEPGQYVYLTIISTRAFSFAQRHPFTIIWWDIEDPFDPSQTEDPVSQPRGVTIHSGEVYRSTVRPLRRNKPSIWLMIDPQRGWTRRIMNHVDTLAGRIAWLDGPYGVRNNIHTFGCVLLFASGTGIFALLPYVKQLAQLAKESRSTTRRIKLVWYTREYHDQVKVWMQRLLDDIDPQIMVSSIPAKRGEALTCSRS